ncbi:class II aldolase/adducin family protein [Alicyclobacillus fastidiosus]|uniref:class II aldolase/adducin family protein n=1 Tax=Alicyclobacillus fastidiosus TaxID=392011 RepID=UPI0023EA1589|nr:class II aldolase/adducin family protein [Alicyclobacillus fastidiosus]GMA59951.1 hypothetical protein GCM10025859_03910 [Alicyclobacillus fastidiosus]
MLNEASMCEKLAVACRILAMEGLVDEILGHVSVRVPDTDEMLIRCRGPYECGVAYTQSDAIQRVTFEGEVRNTGTTCLRSSLSTPKYIKLGPM